MALLTRAELEKSLSPQDVAQLADLEAIGFESDGTVDTALANAEAEVLGYLGVDAATPLPAQTLTDLKRMAVAVTRYNLYQRHVSEDHPVYLAYRQVVQELKDIAAGRKPILLPQETPTGTGTHAHAPDRVFTDTRLTGMVP